MIRLFTFLFLTFFTLQAFASVNTAIVVNGSFPGAQGKEIRLMKYGDQITYREIEIGSTIIDESGRFQFAFESIDPIYVFFRIDHARMGLFAQPDSNYLLEFEPVDFTTLDDKNNPYLNPLYFSFRILRPQNDINKYISELEDVLYDFLSDNFSLIYKSRNPAIFKPIKDKTDSLFAHVENDFFRNYYRYLYAYYMQVSNLMSFNDMVSEYLLNQEILYHNSQYMNLFNTVFDTYIFAGSRSITLSDLRHTVNNLNSYHALMDSLGKDTILRNEVLRELVMLKGLQDMYDNPDYRKANVEDILTYVKENSKFPHHRYIAGNILHSKKYFAPGYPAPSFEVVDRSGDTLRVPDDFKGKYLYLGFWASWCETCLLDFVAMNALQDHYGENLSILGISTDRHFPEYTSVMEKQDPHWKTAHFKGNYRLLDTYMVKSLPTYILISPEGKILSYPALGPSEDFATNFDRLLYLEQRRRSQEP